MTRCFLLILAVSLGLAAASTDDLIARTETRLKNSPEDAAVRDELAGAFLQKMRETGDGAYLTRAEYLVNSILRAEPSNYTARRRQIEIEMQRHHFKKVIALAGALANEHPEDTAVLALLGDACMESGDYERAGEIYQKMVDLRPGVASYNRIAFFRFVTGDAEGAIQIARRAVAIGASSPENQAWCLVDLGNMLLKTGALEEAGQSYRAALQTFPGYHHALAGLGRFMAAKDRPDQAIAFLLQAQAKVPFPEYAGMLAKLYRQIGKPELAQKQIAMLDVADKLDRAAGENANRNLALAFADLGYRTGRALELARAELDVRRDVYTWDALAWALFRDGKITEADEAIRKALAQNTPEPSFQEHAKQIARAQAR